MITQPAAPWESRLLALAWEGMESLGHAEPVQAEEKVLQQAYATCEAITRSHSRTFFMASQFLPAGKRLAVRALYAFCRTTDDLVDRGTGDPAAALEDWRHRALASHPSLDDPVALAWADTRSRYRIPHRYAEQLITGVGHDLVQTRYSTFEDLSAYCYGVASTVGLMAMHIIGFSGPEAIPYAIKLGIALQLTNILRDVGEDWQAGRLYLPLDELAAFGLSEQDIDRGHLGQRWRAFIHFQIQRNRRLYTEAEAGIALLNLDGRFAIAAAASLYQAILDDIEDHQGQVFKRRARIGLWGKLRRLPGIWRKTRYSTINQIDRI